MVARTVSVRICLCMSACNSARMCETNMQFPALLNPRLSAVWCLACLRMEGLTGLEWNSGHLFQGIIGTIFFSLIQLECKHCTSGDLECFKFQQSDAIYSLVLWAYWCLLGPAPVLAPGQQVGMITEAWLCCVCDKRMKVGELLFTPTGLGVTAGQRPESNSQMSWDAEWSGLAPVLLRIHFTTSSFLLSPCPNELQESQCLVVKCPGMQINYSQ